MYVSKKEMTGTKVHVCKGTGIVDASPQEILELLLSAERWAELDPTLDKVEVVDRIDDYNEVLVLQFGNHKEKDKERGKDKDRDNNASSLAFNNNDAAAADNQSGLTSKGTSSSSSPLASPRLSKVNAAPDSPRPAKNSDWPR